MKSELEKLIDLQTTDSNIRRLKKTIETADQRRAEIQQEFEQHASSIREIQARRDSLKAEQADFERQAADNRVYLERAERNLKHAQNQKEYETAMRETDSLQKQITTFETQAAEKLAEVEEVEKSLTERAEEIDSLESKREAAIADFDTEVSKAKAELEGAAAHREKIFATLPKNFASVYDRLVQRSKDGIAVAEVVNGSCSSCFMALRPQMQLEVKRGDAIITCENCTRIMYIAAKDGAAV